MSSQEATGYRRRAAGQIEITIPEGQLYPDVDLMSSQMREIYLEHGVPLYQAALKGDWKAAEEVFLSYPDCVCARITKKQDTALHIAAAAKRIDFVTQLVRKIHRENLTLKNQEGNTALSFAAASGDVDIAKVMVEKNDRLPMIRGHADMTPLQMAALLGHRKMVQYLLPVTDAQLNSVDRVNLLISTINTDMYDIALGIFDSHPNLALERDGNNETALHALSRKPLKSNWSQESVWRRWRPICSNKSQPQSLALQLVKALWKEVIKKDDSTISELIGWPRRLLFDAAEVGNVEFLATLISSYPDLVWKVNEQRYSIFHVAVLNRQEEIFNLIYDIGAIKDLLATYQDSDKNNILHLAGKSPPLGRLQCVSGAALQMQRELLWFKVVKEMFPQYAEAKNISGQTPRALFTDRHEFLRKQGEDWMKSTANYSMVVAALITTVVFTAAFTVPGGNNDAKGSPILLHKSSFKVFAISDAISLFLSSASILMFLSILTSRYAEEDFQRRLPFKLMVGITCLFLSIAAMMVAFTTTYFIIFENGVQWIAPIASLACILVIVFAIEQYPLLADIYHSTFKSSYLFGASKLKLY